MVKDNRFEMWATSHGYEFDYGKKDFVDKDGRSIEDKESELRLRSLSGEIPKDSPDYRATDRDVSFDKVRGEFSTALSEAYDKGEEYIKKTDTKREFATFSSDKVAAEVKSALDTEGKPGLTGFVEPALEKRATEITTKGEDVLAKIEKATTQEQADAITREVDRIADPEVKDAVKRIAGIGGGEPTVIIKSPTTTVVIAPRDTGRASSAWGSMLGRIEKTENIRQKVLNIINEPPAVQQAFKDQLNRGRSKATTTFAEYNKLSLTEAENLLISLGYRIDVTPSGQRRFKPY